MKLYLFKKTEGIKAEAKYDVDTNELTVLKGSQVSGKESHSKSFRGAKSLEEMREKYVKNGIVAENGKFTSPSTAANFITGCSTNGMLAWRDENNTDLKTILFKLGKAK